MGIGKIITSVVLAGALVFGVGGCSRSHSQYRHNGNIGDEHVRFSETFRMAGLRCDINTLTVTKPDGKIVEYIDSDRDDLRVEYVKITKDDLTATYNANNEVGRQILEEAQVQFDEYLRRIEEANVNRGRNNMNRKI